MFVVGTDNGGLWHPNWNQNLKFAIKIQEKAEEMYPGLFKPITLTKSRYNQHTGKYASIIEVGATRKYIRTMFNKYEILSKSDGRSNLKDSLIPYIELTFLSFYVTI